MRATLCLITIALALAACGEDDATSVPDPGDTTTCTEAICDDWRVNSTGETAPILSGLAVDVQSVSEEGEYVRITSAGIPSYVHTLTAAEAHTLNDRPKAAEDFVDGAPKVAAGDAVTFGQDVGYDNDNCAQGAGRGYWPPGPACPGDAGHDVYFPRSPETATATCYTALNAVGLLLNGVAIFNWWDAQSYNGDGVWSLTAAIAEQYDVDVCGGHAAGDTYHHHANPNCLAEQLGDSGGGHSPIYGYAADGYPIHGPHHAAGQTVEACWRPREYDTAGSETGCSEVGKRTCVMVDPMNPALGASEGTTAGPDTSADYTTLSGNVVPATSGLFYEDWYYDAGCRDAGVHTLDASNGHDHDGLGYHYHFSLAFPYTMGPIFAGKLHDNGMVVCNAEPTVQRGRGGPPGGGPPPR